MFLKVNKIIAYSFISLFVFSTHQAIAKDKRPPVIAVSGSGSMSIAPDMAIMSFGVLKEAKTAREALDQNNKAMSDIFKAMKENGIEDKDMQTSGFSIQPRYFYPKPKANGEQKPPSIIGYMVSNNVTLRIRDLEKVGSILDLSVTLGINSGGNIQFTNEDASEAIKQARIKAVKDAKSKAETLVETAGAKLGKIVSINENSRNPRPVALAQAKSLRVQEDASVPIASGENQYNVNVQISWEIEQ
jgi:uncharacterized protein YggE